MKGGLLFLAATLVACSSSKSTEPYPTTSVSLQPGQQQSPVQGMYVVLMKVENDSRCPQGVVCVWQGDAEVHLGISSNMLDITAPAVLHTGIEPRSVVRYGYEFRLDSLTPPARSGPQIPQADYRAWISVRFLPD
jgi:hypothetical protein